MTNDSDFYSDEDLSPESGSTSGSPHSDAIPPADLPPARATSSPVNDSLFELQTFDTQTFDLRAQGMPHAARAASSLPRPAPAPAARRARPDSAAPALNLRATTAHASPPVTARQTSARRSSTHRNQKRRSSSRSTPVWLSTVRSMMVMVLAAMLVSTIFSLWTSPNFFSDEFRAGLNRVQATQHVVNIQPTPLPTDTHELRIGIIIGHSGPPQDTSFVEDPGAVCPDGLKELDINTSVAQRVVAQLNSKGYSVDLLAEFDPRLESYLGDALLSIHSNDCQDYGDAGTGYSVAAASARQTTRGADEFLRECLRTQYGQTTGLPEHGEVTYDMSEYHNFNEVSPDTPTAIIELGFMYRDRAILTGSPDIIAQGIVNGLHCFLGAAPASR